MPRAAATISVLGGTALLAFVAVNVARAAIRAAALPRYWRSRASEPMRADAFRIVALGDSAVQAVGASHPTDGFAGRIATHIEERTGRPVHIVNLADGGRTTGRLVADLPRANLATADLVIVATSTDLERRTPLPEYREALTRLVAALPASRTVVSDLPLLPGRAPYQRILTEAADARGIARADFAAVFRTVGRRLDIFSWLPPHLNSRGYRYWFEAFRPHVDAILERRLERARARL
jgi:lysophospholipase L1-like esterase